MQLAVIVFSTRYVFKLLDKFNPRTADGPDGLFLSFYRTLPNALRRPWRIFSQFHSYMPRLGKHFLKMVIQQDYFELPFYFIKSISCKIMVTLIKDVL